MQSLSVDNYALGIAFDDQHKPVAVIANARAIDQHGHLLKHCNRATQTTNALNLFGNDLHLALINPEPAIIDALALNIPLVLIDEDAHFEIAITLRQTQQ